MTVRIPKYGLHKARNCAVVTLAGKDQYLGEYDSPPSHEPTGDPSHWSVSPADLDTQVPKSHPKECLGPQGQSSGRRDDRHTEFGRSRHSQGRPRVIVNDPALRISRQVGEAQFDVERWQGIQRHRWGTVGAASAVFPVRRTRRVTPWRAAWLT
jgi:hypothetical protein